MFNVPADRTWEFLEKFSDAWVIEIIVCTYGLNSPRRKKMCNVFADAGVDESVVLGDVVFSIWEVCVHRLGGGFLFM